RRHTRSKRDWSSDVCSSDLQILADEEHAELHAGIFRVITRRQFLLRFGQVERGTVDLGTTGDQEGDEPEELWNHVPHATLRFDRSEERRVGKERTDTR